MSEVDLNIFGLDKAGLIDFYGDLKRKDRTQWFPTKDALRTLIHWLNREEENANFRFKFIRCRADYGETIQTETGSFALRLTADEIRRPLFIKFPNEVHIKDINGDKVVKTECLFLAQGYGTGGQGITLSSFPEGNTIIDSTLHANNNPVYTEYTTTIRTSLTTEGLTTYYGSTTELENWANWKVSGDGTRDVLHRRWSSEQKADIIAKMTAILNGINHGSQPKTLNVTTDYAYWDDQFSTFFNAWALPRYETDFIITYDELPFPVFDYTQVDDIIKYINTGDSSGALDVFDSNNPKKEVVEDFKSNAKTFITNLNNLGHVQFKTVWYNDEYIAGGEDVWGAYNVKCYERYFETDGTPKAWQYLTSSSTKYPTITLDHSFSPVSDGEYWEVLYEMLAIDDYDENDHLKGGFAWSVRYKHDNSKEYRVKVDSVRVYPNFNLAPTTFASTSKSNIVDGYRYTNETYNKWHEIYFRAITLDDLKGYDNPEDKEDDTSGSDSDFSGASGLRTFNISNSDFEVINNKLWSTDWTTVFKSTSIDPVKCIISCKGIPFTADNVSSANVIIANMNTGLTKNYVKNVKSFNVGSVLMPHYNDDFTDITLTHIRCYLPYIGWVELPASECISRVAYSKVGIEARPKRLKFKYLVDFVDGSVRCVVSVNDTERWFFDGNCSVDIPVTSDNHTQAVSNALRSGLQTGLSIATAVAGAYTSNAGAVAGGVIGAMQNAPNIFPTYSYTATANGSGYINASMNTHIMIVIERPNTIKSTDYAKRVGVPCGLSLNLGSLHGFTVCKEVDVTGIDATPDELAMIKSLLESGVYL